MPSNLPPVQFKDARLREQVISRTGDPSVGPVNQRAKHDLRAFYGLMDGVLRDNPVTIGGARALATIYLRDGTTAAQITSSPVVSAAYDDACRRLFALGLANPLVGREYDYLAAGFRLRDE